MNDRNDLLNDYLMGDISPERRAELEREIAADPRLAEEVAQLAPLVASLETLPDEAWQSADPPPLRLNTAPRAERPAPAPAVREGLRARWSLRPAFAFAAAVLIFIGGVGAGLLIERSDPSPTAPATLQAATLEPVSSLDPKAAGRAAVKGDGQTIKLTLRGLAPNSQEDFYEAWLMDQTNGFVSLGTFRVGDDGAVTLDLPVAVGTDRFPVVDISLQPVNGKPDHSGVSVLRGELES